MKLSGLCLPVKLTSESIRGKGQESLGHSLFKYVKPTQSLYLPFFFYISTMLATQSGWWASTIKLASLSLTISASTILLRFILLLHFRWILGIAVGSRWIWRQIIEGSVLGMSSQTRRIRHCWLTWRQWSYFLDLTFFIWFWPCIRSIKIKT